MSKLTSRQQAIVDIIKKYHTVDRYSGRITQWNPVQAAVEIENLLLDDQSQSDIPNNCVSGSETPNKGGKTVSEATHNDSENQPKQSQNSVETVSEAKCPDCGGSGEVKNKRWEDGWDVWGNQAPEEYTPKQETLL